jgi:hypothetical protein
MMIGHFAGKLMNKFNLGNMQANNVAGNLIPGVLGSLVNKVNDPDDTGFSLENLLSSITGGKSTEVIQRDSPDAGNSLQDLLSKFGGEGQGGGGGLMDIIGKLAGGAQAQQQKNGGGGLLDLIKGFSK